MKLQAVLSMVLGAALVVGCATTEFKAFEGKTELFEGAGGTRVVVDGMDIWDNGEPPRRFRVLGIIDDERPGGLIPMAQLRRDVVKKAREAGGDALINLGSQSRVAGYYSTGTTSAYGYGNAATLPVRRNTAKFAVISYSE